MLGDLGVSVLSDSSATMELQGLSGRPSDAVVLHDGRIVIALPSDDPLLGGSLAIYRPGQSSSAVRVVPRSGWNVWGLDATDTRLAVTVSGWTTASIDIEHLPKR